MVKILPSEITPEHVFLNRRQFMAASGALAGALALSACAPGLGGEPASEVGALQPAVTTTLGPDKLPAALAYTEPTASSGQDELGDPLNTFQEITNYNNFYEFSTSKEAVASAAASFQSYPWQVAVTGLVNNPLTLDLDDLYAQYTQQEHIFRLRCVEAWSMVIPWVGFPLAELLKEADPQSNAQYVQFVTVYRPEEMPGQRSSILEWPYQEGLRIDEAMNPLAILATGMYGKPLTNQQGAPVRLVVPWKYGFKSIKSVVSIVLTESLPATTWNTAAPHEYGFYANVNPAVDHPRWSQASERRIGENGRRPTLPFNGYAEEVAALYTGMDLTRSF
jgi:sulfoxide reductase catalytic subunit YedY